MPDKDLVDIARRLIHEKEYVSILGDNPDTSTAEEDVWEGTTSNRYVVPAAAGIQMEIVSSSVQDGVAGTGILTVKIHYLDPNFVRRTEDITMNGTTPVNTVATNIRRVNQIEHLTSGTDNEAAGDITLEDTTSAVEYARIRAGHTQSLAAFYTVPDGFTFFITDWNVSAVATNANRTSELELLATVDYAGDLVDGVFRIVDILHETIGAEFDPFEIPVRIPEHADVKVSVISSAAMEVSTHVQGWIEHNPI